MAKLIFDANDVKRVVEHSLIAPQQGEQLVDHDAGGLPITEPVAEPAVLLVHDHGVYLMSNGKPRDIVGPDGEGCLDESRDEGRSFLAYAKGCDPNKDPEWFDTACALVGDDDFGVTLSWARELKAIVDGGAKIVVIEFGPDDIKIMH
jgi:hypothetical protein